jgi:hypothetical protein
MMVRIRRESKLRPGAVRVPVPSESGLLGLLEVVSLTAGHPS